MKSKSFIRLSIFLTLLFGISINYSNCSLFKSSKSESSIKKSDSSRKTDIKPLSEVLKAVEKYKENDPNASFSFFNGHVDNFATSAKSTVPDYAKPILKSLGLSTSPRTPLKIGAPTSAKETPKPGYDLDGDFGRKLPFVLEEDFEDNDSKGKDDEVETSTGETPKRENRTVSAIDPHRMIDWDRPSDEQLHIEKKAVEPILIAFLQKEKDVFRVNQNEFRVSMKLDDYQCGAYFRKAIYHQRYSQNENILYGKTLVHFDVNWNVIGISRMIITPEKLKIGDRPKEIISKEKAVEIASNAFEQECSREKLETLIAEVAIDPIRRKKVWNIELHSSDGNCHWQTIMDVTNGQVLNVSDLDGKHTDAQVNRWYYPNGDLYSPSQIVSTNQYTRNNRRLIHDFFYVMNDHRCEGDPETNCEATGHDDTWCEEAHGAYNGGSFIRPTRRTNRDWSSYFPGAESETFAETHCYFWARQFCQWLKPTIDALGVLPSSASDYPRVLIIPNACRSGDVWRYSYSITTEDNRGEGDDVILLGHRNPSGNANRNSSCQGGGCFFNPSVLHHELNHFFLSRYFGVNPVLDCRRGNELKYTHEGILGSTIPQAFWHHYYNVGYNPLSSNRLYNSDNGAGRVHTDDSNLSTLSDYCCVDLIDGETYGGYSWGRVVGQALWKFYHGIMVNGASFSGTWYPSTDTDFNILVYWAADLQSGSTYKDRYEFANRIMEILDLHSNWSSSGKQDYCEIFETHELDVFINSSYCE